MQLLHLDVLQLVKQLQVVRCPSCLTEAAVHRLFQLSLPGNELTLTVRVVLLKSCRCDLVLLQLMCFGRAHRLLPGLLALSLLLRIFVLFMTAGLVQVLNEESGRALLP